MSYRSREFSPAQSHDEEEPAWDRPFIDDYGRAHDAAEASRPPGRRSLTDAMVVQRQVRVGGPAAVGDPPAAAGGGAPLAPAVRRRMEMSFGADFSAVRIHEGDAADRMGAVAFARGNDIHFGPGNYDPFSESGLSLLGHELAHVVQQRAGRVAPDQMMGKAPLNSSPALEGEADAAGARAARGEPAGLTGGGAAAALDAIQCAVKVAGEDLNTVDAMKQKIDPKRTPEDWAPLETALKNVLERGGTYESVPKLAEAVRVEQLALLKQRYDTIAGMMQTVDRAVKGSKFDAAGWDGWHEQWFESDFGYYGKALRQADLKMKPVHEVFVKYEQYLQPLVRTISEREMKDRDAREMRERNAQRMQEGNARKQDDDRDGPLRKWFPDVELPGDVNLRQIASDNVTALVKSEAAGFKKLVATYPAKAVLANLCKKAGVALSLLREWLQKDVGVEYAAANPKAAGFQAETAGMIAALRETAAPKALTSEDETIERVIGRIMIINPQKDILTSELAVSGGGQGVDYSRGAVEAHTLGQQGGALRGSTYSVVEGKHSQHDYRHMDTEVKLLEWAMSQSGKEGFVNLEGCALFLYTTSYACPSCQDLMYKFKTRFPKVGKVTLLSEKGPIDR